MRSSGTHAGSGEIRRAGENRLARCAEAGAEFSGRGDFVSNVPQVVTMTEWAAEKV